MIPDRSNYEIWLIDYLDGNLDPRQVEQLISFLENNPDIKEEFNEITQYNISPDNNSFRHKNNLKKTVSDLSESQFEYLCVAALENDLSDSQAAELNEIFAESPEKRKTYELIQKLKLSAPMVEYRKKYKLIKLTTMQRIVRFTAIGLSVAATIAIMISIFNISVNKSTRIAIVNLKDTNAVVANQVKRAPIIPAVVEKETKYLPLNNDLSLQKTVSDEMKSSKTGSSVADSTIIKSTIQPVIISKIDYKENVRIAKGNFVGTLVAIKTPGNNIPGTIEEPGSGGFIAKIFREKILKASDPEQGQLKVFEIADAGITGLNKLLGWQMSLKKNKDTKGEVKSVYFSSKLLKFNAPVKKVASLP
jgi:hypothetical protein